MSLGWRSLGRNVDTAAAPTGAQPVHVGVSRMRRRHIRQVLRIEQQVYPRPWSASVFHSELAQVGESRAYLVAEIGHRLVGYGGLWLTPDGAHITNLAVDPGWQRRQIATRLLLGLAHVARSRDARALTLEVRTSNEAAQALYRRFGFAPAGVRRRYYEGVEDAIVMWAHDIDQRAYAVRLREIEVSVSGSTTWPPEAER
jgi:[ribosomal protein S18]-alanine N-acetyltransferase